MYCKSMQQLLMMIQGDTLYTQTIQKLGRMCQQSTSGKKIRLQGSMTLVDMVCRCSMTLHQQTR